MTSAEIRQRSDLLGTMVVTRDTGKKLGVVSQLWVDIDQQEVVALSLRPNLLYGTPQPMLLSSIRQIGDVILVDDDTVIEDSLDVESYNSLINCEVITETGELLGKVRGFKFDVDTGRLTSLIIASLGLPLIPDQVVSTYELSVDEIVSSGPDRLIVFEGSEERVMQLTVGVLERLGIGKPIWEREMEEDYTLPTRVENQLGTGLRTPVSTPMRQRQPVQEAWDEDNWREPEPRQLQQRQAEPLYYEEEEEENWSEASSHDRYERQPVPEPDYEDEDTDLELDAWADEDAKPYEAPRVNFADKVKEKQYEPEYEDGY
ncbi:MAG TPA: PRC-barrel domain-containing protein [Coleofasciculaceae cyanobacterium]